MDTSLFQMIIDERGTLNWGIAPFVLFIVAGLVTDVLFVQFLIRFAV